MKIYIAGFFIGAHRDLLCSGIDYDYHLESFHYIGRNRLAIEMVRHHKRKLFVDSGAFSAFTKGVEIDIDAYMQWVEKHRDIVELVAALDVIGDARRSWENYEYMRKRMPCIPTFHYGEPFEFLDNLVEESDYIAIGGVAQLKTGPRIFRFFDACWDRLVDEEGRPKVKVHGFGVTSFSAMMRYPWYSVDSTSWLQAARFGKIFIPGRGGRISRVDISIESPRRKDMDLHYDSLSPVHREHVDRFIEGLGFDPERLRNEYGQRDAYNIAFMKRLCHRPEPRFRKQSMELFDV